MIRALPRIELSGKRSAERNSEDSKKLGPRERLGSPHVENNAKSLVVRLNRKLASEGKAVVKNHRKNASLPGHEYCLLDPAEGTALYLSLSDVEHLV
jgi:hypothetical protein